MNRTLRDALFAKGKTVKQAADFLKISEFQFKNRMNGKIPFDVMQVLLLCSWLELEDLREKTEIFCSKRPKNGIKEEV